MVFKRLWMNVFEFQKGWWWFIGLLKSIERSFDFSFHNNIFFNFFFFFCLYFDKKKFVENCNTKIKMKSQHGGSIFIYCWNFDSINISLSEKWMNWVICYWAIRVLDFFFFSTNQLVVNVTALSTKQNKNEFYFVLLSSIINIYYSKQ